jgi:hypothetical protein
MLNLTGQGMDFQKMLQGIWKNETFAIKECRYNEKIYSA